MWELSILSDSTIKPFLKGLIEELLIINPEGPGDLHELYMSYMVSYMVIDSLCCSIYGHNLPHVFNSSCT